MRRPRAVGRRQRGVALVLVLWAFMTLGILAFDFGRYIRDDAMAAVNFADETQGYYVALAGMNRALWDARRVLNGERIASWTSGSVEDPDDEREDDVVPADGEWHPGTFAGASYEVRVTDECSRLALNRIADRAAAEPDDRELLKRVITNLLQGGNRTRGTSSRTAADIDEIVDAIIDWVDTNSLKSTNGAESKYYLDAHGYPAKNGYFDSPQDLLLVRGIDADLFYGGEGRPGLRDVVSVECRADTINVRSVTAPVLQVLLNLEPEEAAQLIEQRKEDGAGFLQVLQAGVAATAPELQDNLVDEPARRVLVEARADTAQPRNQSNVAAVVDLGEETGFDGPVILRWLDRAPFTGRLPSGDIPETAS